MLESNNWNHRVTCEVRAGRTSWSRRNCWRCKHHDAAWTMRDMFSTADCC